MEAVAQHYFAYDPLLRRGPRSGGGAEATILGDRCMASKAFFSLSSITLRHYPGTTIRQNRVFLRRFSCQDAENAKFFRLCALCGFARVSYLVAVLLPQGFRGEYFLLSGLLFGLRAYARRKTHSFLSLTFQGHR